MSHIGVPLPLQTAPNNPNSVDSSWRNTTAGTASLAIPECCTNTNLTWTGVENELPALSATTIPPVASVTRNPYRTTTNNNNYKRSRSLSAATTDQHQQQQQQEQHKRHTMAFASVPGKWTFPTPAPMQTRIPTTATGTSLRLLSQKHISPCTALDLLRQNRAFHGMGATATSSPPLHLMRSRENASSSSFSIDWLRLQPGVIHELSGPAGTGKTQIALTLCIQAAMAAAAATTTALDPHRRRLPGTHHDDCNSHPPIRAVYLALGSTRIHHVVERLHHMAKSMPSCPDVLQRILTKCCVSVEDLMPLLLKTMPALLDQERGVRLVILDCVANVVRHTDPDAYTPHQRSALLFQMAAALQNLMAKSSLSSDAPPITILVLNQATAAASQCWNHGQMPNNTSSAADAWTPALGLSWAHCVHSRFQSHRRERVTTDDPSSAAENHHPSRVIFDRTIHLVHSNRYAPASASFAIDSAGCYLLDKTHAEN